MIFGIPMEIRDNEYRVGAVPFLVEELVKRGHQVLVETNAGDKSHHSDGDYENSGAVIVPSPEKLYGQSEHILKVRSPKPVEYDLIKPHHTVFAFFNFFNHLEMTRSLMARGCSCFAYELLKTKENIRPILNMDRAIAGQLAVQQGAYFLECQNGGRGVLIGEALGVSPARVVVIGANAAGVAAANYAARSGASVHLLDEDPALLESIREKLPANVNTLINHEQNLKKILPATDLLISATQQVENKTYEIISEAAVKTLPEGAVIIDLDIENGGSIATCTPTKFENPTFVKHGVIHYCVPNLPGAVPASASEALSSALLPYVLRFIDTTPTSVFQEDGEFRSGLVVFEGRIVNEALAKELDVQYYDIKEHRA